VSPFKGLSISTLSASVQKDLQATMDEENSSIWVGPAKSFIYNIFGFGLFSCTAHMTT